MKKKSVPPVLQEILRNTLHRIQELEKLELNLKVQGEDGRWVRRLIVAYRRLLEVCFEIFEMGEGG